MEIEDFSEQSAEQENVPKKKNSPLLSLEEDLKLYAASIKEVSQEIRQEGLSNYPIFIAYQQQVSIGELILDRTELGTAWSINAATLEEFVEKGIVLPNKKEHFIKNYKQAQDYCCLFVVVSEGANFVYYPYPKQ